ncbi:hypothetical protein CSKR_104907 [Clonorchis sinensis]|uniref:Uncharacterized protein n=1 Tax=Clonorchis sinensis TaxID=79923 RepID=A0A3R7DIT2_CLOSI|nr:hypothetical protein CSKR_104907 [Clonorchis sinensis]
MCPISGSPSKETAMTSAPELAGTGLHVMAITAMLFDLPLLVSVLRVVARKEPFEEFGRLAYGARGQARATYGTFQHTPTLLIRCSHQTQTVLRRNRWPNTESLLASSARRSHVSHPYSNVDRTAALSDPRRAISFAYSIYVSECRGNTLTPQALEAYTESSVIVSMTKLKRKGERRQPCLTPLDVVNSVESFLARLSSVAKSFSISRAFDSHQSSRSVLGLFTIWCLRDMRVPSYSFPAGIAFLASVRSSDLDNIQWSCGRIGEVRQTALNAASIAPFTFFHSSSTACQTARQNYLDYLILSALPRRQIQEELCRLRTRYLWANAPGVLRPHRHQRLIAKVFRRHSNIRGSWHTVPQRGSIINGYTFAPDTATVPDGRESQRQLSGQGTQPLSAAGSSVAVPESRPLSLVVSLTAAFPVSVDIGYGCFPEQKLSPSPELSMSTRALGLSLGTSVFGV